MLSKIRPSRRILGIKGSATLRLAEEAELMKAKGIDVINLAIGEPDFDTPRYIKSRAIQAIRQGHTRYTVPSGILPLRKAIAARIRKGLDLNYGVDSILVSCGAKHAIYNILNVLCDPGDEVLIPVPYWTSYPEMVRSIGARPVFIRTMESEGFKLRPRQLYRHLTPRTKLLILNTPCNPTGAVYTWDELKALADLIRRTRLLVLTDEVYEKFVYGRATHISIASLPGMKGRTVVVSGVSKTYAMTGWRIGYAAGPAEIISLAAALQSQSTSNPATPSQYAALAAIDSDQGCVKVMVKEYNTRRDYLIQRVAQLPGVRFNTPEGAFYLFPRVCKYYGARAGNILIKDSQTFSEALLRVARVAVTPGSAFGADKHIRISYSVSMREIREGLDRIAGFLRGLG